MRTKSGGKNNPIGFDVPPLIVPIDALVKPCSKLVPRATLKIYPDGSNRFGDTSKAQVNADLQEFVLS